MTEMKKIVAILFLLIGMTGVAFAQEDKSKDNVIYAEVPKNLNIKDKIIIRNSSPYTILQAVVVLEEDGNEELLGSASYIAPNKSIEIAKYENNKLKKLRGKKLAIKVKGVKKVLGDKQTTQVGGGSLALGPFEVGVTHSDIKAEEVNNIDASQIVYNFAVSLAEENHDLYIKVSASGENGVFDF
jgi:hypothetical protein